jgi:DNA-binding response OmpR family regulator
MLRILIVEDELPMRTALTDLLRANGYRVTAAVDGVAGLERALEDKPDLVLLDVMMPRLDGFAVCREIRRRLVTLPMIIITAKGQVDDRVSGLDAGADDYLVKPFSSRELLARVRAALRRADRAQTSVERVRLGDVEIDFEMQQCRRGATQVHLSAKEFRILRLLAERQGSPVTREDFLEIVWGYNAYPTTRTVDNQILSLRNKLEPDPAQPQFLLTVHGVGYRLEMTRA